MIEVNKETLLEQALLATNLDHIQEMVDKVIEIVAGKNVEYGDAWQLYGVLTPLLRIKENMFRVESMSDGTSKVIYYPDIEKRLVDIAGYALLAMAWLKSEEGLSLLAKLDTIQDENEVGSDAWYKRLSRAIQEAKSLPWNFDPVDDINKVVDQLQDDWKRANESIMSGGWRHIPGIAFVDEAAGIDRNFFAGADSEELLNKFGGKWAVVGKIDETVLLEQEDEMQAFEIRVIVQCDERTAMELANLFQDIGNLGDLSKDPADYRVQGLSVARLDENGKTIFNKGGE